MNVSVPKKLTSGTKRTLYALVAGNNSAVLADTPLIVVHDVPLLLLYCQTPSLVSMAVMAIPLSAPASTSLNDVARSATVVPVLLALSLFAFGEALAAWAPALQTNGLQMLVWGFCISTVVLYHATFTINSLAHRFGRRRYATRDESRNNPWLALLTLGEGWHNNHHHYPGSARQGFYWWEVDVTYYGLRLLAALGIIWDLKAVPARVRAARREGVR